MIDNRTIRAKKNIVVSLANQIATLFCGLIVPKLMIEAFGSEAYGATSSITQFLAYITLLEGGIGGVARAVLYKPLAEGDLPTISAIMAEIKRFFRIIALIFTGYVLILAFCFKSISRIECMDWLSTFFLVIVISISTFGQYFIGISNTILLQASQKAYITNTVSMCATVINAILSIVLIKIGYNLIIVKLVSSCIFLLRPVILWLYVKKNYALNQSSISQKTGKYLTQKRTGLSQHIAYFLHSNTDIAVLTIFANLKSVSVYAVYNMITSHIQNLASSFSSGMEAAFGDMYARDERDVILNAFSVYETLISVTSTIMFATTAVLTIPFIKIYTANISDVNYIYPMVALMMTLTSWSYCLRLPYHSMIIAAGHFKQTQTAAYGEATINIALSVMLVGHFNLIGVVVATFIATWFRFIYYVYYLSKNIIFRNVKLFIKRIVVNTSAYVCSCLIGAGIVSLINISDFFVWIGCSMVVFVVVGGITLAINLWFYKDNLSILMDKLKKK